MARPVFPRSIVEFQRLFPDEEACRAYLFASRWPDGFCCPACGGDAVGGEQRRHVWQCTLSNLKTWLQGTHHGVSPKHLPVYLDEFVFRHNRRRTPLAGFQTLLGLGTAHPPTTYHQVTRRSEKPAAEQTG